MRWDRPGALPWLQLPVRNKQNDHIEVQLPKRRHLWFHVGNIMNLWRVIDVQGSGLRSHMFMWPLTWFKTSKENLSWHSPCPNFLPAKLFWCQRPTIWKQSVLTPQRLSPEYPCRHNPLWLFSVRKSNKLVTASVFNCIYQNARGMNWKNYSF